MTATADIYPTFLLALCAWREARGEPTEAQRGVIHVVLNRAAKPSWWGKDVVSCVICPYQFESFNHNDPNAVKFPQPGDAVFANIMVMAVAPGDDPTGDATHYYSIDISMPVWATTMTFTVQIGHIRFYKL